RRAFRRPRYDARRKACARHARRPLRRRARRRFDGRDSGRARRSVIEAVLDASVVIKWFRAQGERHVEPARALRAAYETGELVVFTPPLLGLEIVNVAGR